MTIVVLSLLCSSHKATSRQQHINTTARKTNQEITTRLHDNTSIRQHDKSTKKLPLGYITSH